MADGEQKIDKGNTGDDNGKAVAKLKDPAPKDGDKQKGNWF